MAKKKIPQIPSLGEEDELVPTVERQIRPEVLRQALNPAVLELLRGPGPKRRFPLLGEALSIGRGKDANISVDSAELSRRHASLTLLESEWTVQDLQSRNGIFLNGVKVHSAVLRDGDKLQLGEVVFVFHEAR